jgi:uncharacterized protein GlcG (DUF336 family)
MPYGPPISLEMAKKAMTAAETEAALNNWAVAIAIVDSGANLVMLHRNDNAQLSSTRIAEAKARTSVEFRRATKAFEEALARMAKSSARSGFQAPASHQDGQIAAAGASVFK